MENSVTGTYPIPKYWHQILIYSEEIGDEGILNKSDYEHFEGKL